jgi:CBS-domain-containing membrane protein
MSNKHVSVSSVMQEEVLTLQVDDTLDLLDDLMARNRIRHVPVLDGDELVGIVSQRDLCASALSAALDYDEEPRTAFLRTIAVEQVMTDEVVHVSPHTTLTGAAELLDRHRIGCLPVVDEERRLVGLVSEGDLMRAAFLDGRTTEHERSRGARSKWKALFGKEIEELTALREEFELQASLGRAEAREKWEELEDRWERISSRLERLQEHTSEEAEGLGERLIGRLRDDYRRLAKLLAVT